MYALVTACELDATHDSCGHSLAVLQPGWKLNSRQLRYQDNGRQLPAFDGLHRPGLLRNPSRHHDRETRCFLFYNVRVGYEYHWPPRQVLDQSLVLRCRRRPVPYLGVVQYSAIVEHETHQHLVLGVGTHYRACLDNNVTSVWKRLRLCSASHFCQG